MSGYERKNRRNFPRISSIALLNPTKRSGKDQKSDAKLDPESKPSIGQIHWDSKKNMRRLYVFKTSGKFLGLPTGEENHDGMLR